MNKLILLLLIPLITIPVAYGATVAPQIEKLPEFFDWLKTQDGKLKNNGWEMSTNQLHADWKRMVYSGFGTLGQHWLPHPSNPDNRDQSKYVRSATGVCADNYEGDISDKLSFTGIFGGNGDSNCKHNIAKFRINYFGFLQKQTHSMSYYEPDNYNFRPVSISGNTDHGHEIVVTCTDPEQHLELLFGNDWRNHPNQLAVQSVLDMIDERIYYVENNFNPLYKAWIKDHAINNQFTHFYNGEKLDTHPDVLVCDL